MPVTITAKVVFPRSKGNLDLFAICPGNVLSYCHEGFSALADGFIS